LELLAKIIHLATSRRVSTSRVSHDPTPYLWWRFSREALTPSPFNHRSRRRACEILRRAMSQNVEVAQAAIEAWNAGDMDAYRELYSPDVILRHLEGWPEPGPSIGREATRQQFARMREAFDADTIEVIGDVVEIADRVVMRFVWRGAGQGPDANIEATTIFTVRKGRIVEQEFIWDHAEALEAVGLRE
jgi:ketosteroid isomerase-like protein